MARGFFISFFLFIIMLLGGYGGPQSTRNILIDEPTSIRMLHEIDSLYLVGDYSRASEEAMILMAYYKRIGNKGGEILCNNYMGDFLRAAGNREGSLEFLTKAIKLNTPTFDSMLLARTYNYLAANYFELDYPLYLDSARKYATASMEIALIHSDNKLLYSDLNILGKVQEGRGNMDSALIYLTQALVIVKRTHPVDVPLVLSNIAGVYFLRGDLLESEKLARESFALAIRDNIPTYIRLASGLLERIYLKRGNYKEAHYYLGELLASTRNFLDEKTEERVSAMREQIRQAQEEAAIQQELSARRMGTLFLLILMGLALAFMVVFALQKSRLRRKNRELTVMNQEIRMQQSETEKLAAELETANATLKNFISIIAHDLKNPFNTIIGFSDLLHTEFHSLTPEERKLAIENTHKSAVSAFSLLDQLLTWARLQTGTFQLEVVTIDMAVLMEEVLNQLSPTAFLKQQTLVQKIPANTLVRADRNMMLAVFRNLLSNAIKFTPKGGTVDVSAVCKAGDVEIYVRDSGIGIPGVDIQKLFRIDGQIKTPGTEGEKGTGVGLLLCKEYLDKNRGTITVESQPGIGTTFTVTLPLETA